MDGWEGSEGGRGRGRGRGRRRGRGRGRGRGEGARRPALGTARTGRGFSHLITPILLLVLRCTLRSMGPTWLASSLSVSTSSSGRASDQFEFL
eukprot:scaffold142583_cov29-Tisochrysis_lutea.AAC.3